MAHFQKTGESSFCQLVEEKKDENLLKKRTILQVSKVLDPIAARKNRKLNARPDAEMTVENSLKFGDLPWDCVELIFEFVPLNHMQEDQKVYMIARLLNRNIYRIINSKRKSLLFKDKNISERAFFDLI